MRKALAATIVIVVAVGLLAQDRGPSARWDCGMNGVPAHPEIGGELIFNCGLPSTNTGFYVLDVATGHVRPLIADGVWNTDPAWSPDGTRIAYVSTKDGETDIYVMDVASAAVTRLTHDPSWNGNPTWSPDGEWIMFDSSRDGTNRSPHNNFRNLFVVRADGTELRRVTSALGYNGAPSWAPSGKLVAFTSDRDGLYHLYTMNADGSDPRGLAPVGHIARWSPDGARVLFPATERPTDDPDAVTHVYTMSIDGRELRQVTDGDDQMPDWTHDGGWIAFARLVGGHRDLFVVSTAGGDPIRLTFDGSSKQWPRWRPR